MKKYSWDRGCGLDGRVREDWSLLARQDSGRGTGGDPLPKVMVVSIGRLPQEEKVPQENYLPKQ